MSTFLPLADEIQSRKHHQVKNDRVDHESNSRIPVSSEKASQGQRGLFGSIQFLHSSLLFVPVKSGKRVHFRFIDVLIPVTNIV